MCAAVAVLVALGIATQLALLWGATHGGISPASKWLSSQNTFVSPFDEAWPNTIGICLLIKLEAAADLREWLQYHRRDNLRMTLLLVAMILHC